MKKILTALLALVIVAPVFSQSQSYIRPNQGSPGIPFIFIPGDTAKALPKSNTGYGLVDTVGAMGSPKITIWASIAVQGNDARYSFNAYPTRYHQIAAACSNVAVTDSGARGTGVYILKGSNTFRDSMYVTFKGTTTMDSTYLIVKKYASLLLIKKKFAIDTLSSDSAITAETGTRLFAKSEKTLFGDWIKRIRLASWSATTPCTLHVEQGLSQ